ncbi:hypothetical protein pipiens_009512 [Culex pipiens pipiens]|uniref:Gustatory receptor n=1 Tax=Culex pipiens pipiens TaxID=38569 RepID=A0ABD1DDJ2_CULPP
MTGTLRSIPLIWKFPKRNIFECMILHYLFLKVNGYACFSISGELEAGKTRTTAVDRAWFLVCLAVVVTLWTINITVVERPVDVSPLLSIGSRLMWFTCYLTVLFGIVWNFLYRDKVWSLYVNVFKVDQQLLALGANMYYTEMYLAMIGFSLVSFVFMGVLNIGHVLDVGFELWEFSTFLYSNASLMMLVTIYSIAGSLVWLRLWALNSVMERDILAGGNPKIIQVKGKDFVQTVRQYMQIYDQLCDLTETVNFCYSMQVMITVAGSFVYLLFFAFGVILFIKENNSVFDFSTASLVWSVFYIMSILLVVAVGSTVRHLGRNTAKLIDRAIDSSTDAEIIEMVGIRTE